MQFCPSQRANRDRVHQRKGRSEGKLRNCQVSTEIFQDNEKHNKKDNELRVGNKNCPILLDIINKPVKHFLK